MESAATARKDQVGEDRKDRTPVPVRLRPDQMWCPLALKKFRLIPQCRRKRDRRRTRVRRNQIPLGFAELPPITPSAAGAGPAGLDGIPPTGPAAASLAAVPTKPGSASDRKQWRNNLAVFAANIRVGTDPAGQPMVDWGELRELREMNDIVVAQRSPEPPARSPEAETPAAISERLGDMHWQLVVDKVEEAPGGLIVPTFHPVDLAKPLELHIALDETEDAQKWAKLAPGSSVKVSARLSISEPYKIMAKVKLDDAK